MRKTVRAAAVGAAATVLAVAGTPAADATDATEQARHAGGIKHLVVIYEENHSFDNLFGGWTRVRGRAVNGVHGPGYAGRATQAGADGKPLACLPQKDVNLTSPPLDPTCGPVALADGTTAASHFTNAPFDITHYIAPADTTCPPGDVSAPDGVLKGKGEPGGCTRDMVHRFYTEQFQLDGGRMDRYTLGSDAAGLTQGRYDTRALPVYAYLHTKGAPRYVLGDRFFQGAFGGSFLNHQYLIAARAPQWADWTEDGAAHSVLDTKGMPAKTPLYANETGQDNPLTQACGTPATVAGFACGDYAVNTVQPFSQPYAPGTADAKRLPPIDDGTSPNIGDELSAKGVAWAWYAGGWDNAAGNTTGPGWTNGTTAGTCGDADHKAAAVYPYCAGNLFQFHHQPFTYFAAYGEGKPGRRHLKDEAAFLAAAKAGKLPAVSFVKPYGEENEHPGYASTDNGESHLVDLLKAVDASPQADDTVVVVTYDEFGGQWDHVPPPGSGTPGPHDAFGPGTRIPFLMLGRPLRRSGVDHTPYDTTSILRTIEKRWHLAPLDKAYGRDAKVADLGSAFRLAGLPLDYPA